MKSLICGNQEGPKLAADGVIFGEGLQLQSGAKQCGDHLGDGMGPLADGTGRKACTRIGIGVAPIFPPRIAIAEITFGDLQILSSQEIGKGMKLSQTKSPAWSQEISNDLCPGVKVR